MTRHDTPPKIPAKAAADALTKVCEAAERAGSTGMVAVEVAYRDGKPISHKVRTERLEKAD